MNVYIAVAESVYIFISMLSIFKIYDCIKIINRCLKAGCWNVTGSTLQQTEETDEDFLQNWVLQGMRS